MHFCSFCYAVLSALCSKPYTTPKLSCLAEVVTHRINPDQSASIPEKKLPQFYCQRPNRHLILAEIPPKKWPNASRVAITP